MQREGEHVPNDYVTARVQAAPAKDEAKPEEPAPARILGTLSQSTGAWNLHLRRHCAPSSAQVGSLRFVIRN